MRVDLLPDTSNVVRFPVERRARPTMELFREIAPDVREVLNLTEAFGMEPPAFDLRAQTDAATAEHIVNHIPSGGGHRSAMPRALEAPVIERAIAACRSEGDAWIEANEAEDALEWARAAGQVWLDPLQDRAEQSAAQAAHLTLEAHAWAERAAGVARAIGLAWRGEAWAPRDHAADIDALIAIAKPWSYCVMDRM